MYAMNLLIDAYKQWDVTTFDVPGAFFQTELLEQAKKVLLKIKRGVCGHYV